MSIHNFSQTAFTDIAKDILVNESFIKIRNADKLDADTSFRETLDITSLDIAELLINLEQKYGLNLEFAQTGNIDCIKDVYKAFLIGMTNKRRKISTRKSQDRMKDIIETAKNIIAEECGITKEMISDDISFRNKLLKFDTLAKYELLMEMEKHYNVFVEDTETAQFERAKTLSEFCEKFINFVYPDKTKKEIKDYSNHKPADIFKVIYNHIYETYTISFAKPTSNWYTDLGLTNFDLSDFYKWIEKEFNIKMPYFYFTDLDKLCTLIYLEIQKQDKVSSFKNRIQTIFTRGK